MEPGQCSGTKQEDDLWAKLVPSDSRYPELEIRSQEMVICSEITCSSLDKCNWCKITRKPDLDSATITNISSNAIIVDETIVGNEEAVDIKCGSEIISGPDSKGYLGYTFEVIPTQIHNRKSLKISLDVEHAKCGICLNVWHDVVTVAPCLHNFCNGCFSEWSRRSSTRPQGRRVLCPHCRATVQSVGRNHFLHNMEEAIVQNFSSLKRCDEEIALLDTYASIKSDTVLEIPKNPSRKRPFPPSSGEIESNNMELPCLQCGTELGGFKCSRTNAHLQCQGCREMMPSRPDIGVPQHCLGCDRAFCGAYWLAQGVDASEFNFICSQETFKPVSERTISRIPDSAHQNNRYELDITEKCIQQTGKTLQAVISDWIIKFNNKEIDRTRLQLNHAEIITGRTHLCIDCYTKLIGYLLYWFRVTMPRHLLPPDAVGREDCWYGYVCRTQHHNDEHARKRNHVCRPTRGNFTS